MKREFKHKNGKLAKKVDHNYYEVEGEVVPVWIIESKNSSDWIEQIEKDYEILEHEITGDITSVKRLSDGEVFSVGDWHKCPYIPGRLKITSILETDDRLWLEHDNGATCLKKAKKWKSSILTTEDGVELFEGDVSFWIRAVNGTGRCIIHTGKIGKTRNPELVYFSTREAAEEYRLNNARVLSIEDVRDNFNNSCMISSLDELVKSRL